MSKDLNKKALADILAEKIEISKKDANEVIETVFNTIADNLKKGGNVEIYGFGKFEVKTRAARNGINPITKEKIKIAASKVPSFKASKSLKDLVK